MQSSQRCHNEGLGGAGIGGGGAVTIIGWSRSLPSSPNVSAVVGKPKPTMKSRYPTRASLVCLSSSFLMSMMAYNSWLPLAPSRNFSVNIPPVGALMFFWWSSNPMFVVVSQTSLKYRVMRGPSGASTTRTAPSSGDRYSWSMKSTMAVSSASLRSASSGKVSSLEPQWRGNPLALSCSKTVPRRPPTVIGISTVTPRTSNHHSSLWLR
mmetsp:Transcript_24887/g.61552  ORF Transcript_24887/g.61552 Transcript_24887/m.61552 type:complete len:209 (-) Transcript_24887:438-1064(-)